MITERSIETIGNPNFASEAREYLINEGYLIYNLQGESISSLRRRGRPFWGTSSEFTEAEDICSIDGEIAINTKSPFLPRSNRLDLVKQQEAILEYSRNIEKKIKSLRAVMGSASDYAEFAFRHFDASGERLFGITHDFPHVRTRTPISQTKNLTVGIFDSINGLLVSAWDKFDDSQNRLWAVPIVIPKVA